MYNRGFIVAAALGAMLVGSPASASPIRHGVTTTAQAAADALLQSDGVTERGEPYMRIDQAARDALAAASDEVIVRLPLDAGNEVQLVLRPFTVIVPGARFVRADGAGDWRAMPRPDVLLLRGEVAGQPGSRAFLSLTGRGGGMGSVTLVSGARYQIDTRHAGGVADGIVVRPTGDDVPDFDEFCSVLVPHGHVAAGGCCGNKPGGEGLERGPRLITLALDGDQRYVELFPTEQDALDYMVQLVGAVSDIYRHDLNFRLMIEFARIWPEGGEPFGADDVGGFRDYWINNEDLTGLNLVHLFSGRRDLSYGGVAYLANACNGEAFGISGYLSGSFPDPVTYPHLGNWDIVVVAHEMGHNLSVLHTQSYDPPLDACITEGIPQRGTIMSYCHTKQGALRNIDLSMHRFMAGLITDEHPHGNCLVYDCNGNGRSDADDIADSRSMDADANGIPDECEDCSGNGMLNSEEIALGAPDVNANGIPDACEADCNGDGVPDRHEIALGSATDINGNFVPDLCEPDCNANRVPDFLDILNETETDLDRDRVPDACQDCLTNGQPDWEDIGRPGFLIVGTDAPTAAGPVREYHAASGVLGDTHGENLVDGAHGLAFDANRALFIASHFNSRVVRVDPDTGASSIFIDTAVHGLTGPSSLLFTDGGELLVTGYVSDNIAQFDGETGTYLGELVPPGATPLNAPTAMILGPDGMLYVATGGNRIERFDAATGAYLGVFVDGSGGTLEGPRGLLFLTDGDLVVTNFLAGTISRFDPSGAYTGQFNDEFALPGPWAIAQGPEGNIYVSRSGPGSRVIMLHPESGIYLRTFVRDDPLMETPRGLAFRPPSPDDLNGNGLPDICDDAASPPDLNGDGTVNVLDLLALLSDWGPCADCPADLNDDGIVNVLDLLVLLGAWG